MIIAKRIIDIVKLEPLLPGVSISVNNGKSRMVFTEDANKAVGLYQGIMQQLNDTRTQFVDFGALLKAK